MLVSQGSEVGRVAGVAPMSDPKHHPAEYVRVTKSDQCLWCGAVGQPMTIRCSVRMTTHPRFECVDRKACDERIKTKIKIAEIVGPGVPR